RDVSAGQERAPDGHGDRRQVLHLGRAARQGRSVVSGKCDAASDLVGTLDERRYSPQRERLELRARDARGRKNLAQVGKVVIGLLAGGPEQADGLTGELKGGFDGPGI